MAVESCQPRLLHGLPADERERFDLRSLSTSTRRPDRASRSREDGDDIAGEIYVR